MSIELKIKSKHLALEPRIINAEMKKLSDQAKWLYHQEEDIPELKGRHIAGEGWVHGYSHPYWRIVHQRGALQEHKDTKVRPESRATYLARAYLAGIPYKIVEQSRKEEKESEFQYRVVPRLIAMVWKYGIDFRTRKDFADRKKEAVLEWLNKE